MDNSSGPKGVSLFQALGSWEREKGEREKNKGGPDRERAWIRLQRGLVFSPLLSEKGRKISEFGLK